MTSIKCLLHLSSPNVSYLKVAIAVQSESQAITGGVTPHKELCKKKSGRNCGTGEEQESQTAVNYTVCIRHCALLPCAFLKTPCVSETLSWML